MQYPWIPSFFPAFVAEVGIVVVSIPAYLLLAFRARCTAVSPARLGSLTSRLYSTASQKAHNKRARPAGTGLGLAIVKHVASRHQARLEIASEEGNGSTFSIAFQAKRRLPLPEENAG